jgi:hypothetical protein
MNELENVIAGLFLCLFTALDREQSAVALETLWTLAADHRTPEYESKLYTDLADSIAETRLPVQDIFEILETLH